MKNFFRFVKMNFLMEYHSPLMAFSRLMGMVVTLTIYYFTSKAFTPLMNSSLEFYQDSYFTFILVGSLSLRLVMSIYAQMTNAFYAVYNGGLFDWLEIAGERSLMKNLWQRSFEVIPHQILLIIIELALAKLIFGMSIPYGRFSVIVLFQFLAAFSVAGVALLSISFFLLTTRGSFIRNYFMTLTSIVSGVYFPVDVFPPWIAKYAFYLSPFNALMLTSRKYIAHGDIGELVSCFWALMIWGIGLMMVAKLLFYWSMRFYRKNGPRFGYGF